MLKNPPANDLSPEAVLSSFITNEERPEEVNPPTPKAKEASPEESISVPLGNPPANEPVFEETIEPAKISEHPKAIELFTSGRLKVQNSIVKIKK